MKRSKGTSQKRREPEITDARQVWLKEHLRLTRKYDFLRTSRGAPQLDDGLFFGRQGGKIVAWAWAKKSGTACPAEVWMLGSGTDAVPPAYARPGIGNPAGSLLVLVPDFPVVDPQGGPITDPFNPAHRSAFYRAIVQYHLDHEDEVVTASTGFGRFMYYSGPTSGLPAGHGLTIPPSSPTTGRLEGPGLYQVRQANHTVESVNPLAWVWRPSNPGSRDIWLITKNDLAGYPFWNRLGVGTGIASADWAFYRVQATLTGAALPLTDANAAANITLFKQWVFDNYVTARDYTDPSNVIPRQLDVEDFKVGTPAS